MSKYSQGFIKELELILVNDNVAVTGRLIKDHDAQPYNIAYTQNSFKPNIAPVIIAKTSEQVQAIINLARKHDISIISQGGRTSLVMGATPHGISPTLILKSEIDNLTLHTDSLLSILAYGSKHTVQECREYAAEAGLLCRLKYGSDGSATFTGASATCAGGSDQTASDIIEQVTAVDGTGQCHVFDNPHQNIVTDSLVPSSTFPPLASQGHFFHITGGKVRLEPMFKEQFTALFGFDDLAVLARAEQLLQRFHGQDGVTLGPVELINHNAMAYACEYSDDRLPLTKDFPYYLLVRLDSTEFGKHDIVVERLIGCLQTENNSDCIIAETLEQTNRLWHLREDISDANRAIAKKLGGTVVSHDLGFPKHAVVRVIPILNELVQVLWGGRVTTFGHMNQRKDCMGQHYNPILGLDDPNPNADLTPLAAKLFTNYCHQYPEHSKHQPGDLEAFVLWAINHFRHYSADKRDQESQPEQWTLSLEHGGLGYKTAPYTAKYLSWSRALDVLALKKQYDPDGVFHKDVWNIFLGELYVRFHQEVGLGLIDKRLAKQIAHAIDHANVNGHNLSNSVENQT